MRKPAAIAIFAASGIVLIQPAYSQDPGGRPIALIPALVPPAVGAFSAPPSHSVANVSVAVRRAVKGSYPSTHYQRGLYLKQRGDLDGALIEFLKSAQENPLNVSAFYEQAVIFRARGYTKLAQSALQQALAVKPDYREARVLLASVHLDDGQLSQAAQELLRSLGINGFGGTPTAQNRKAAPPEVESQSSYGLMPPSLIQTPHGKLKLPTPPAVVSTSTLASVPLQGKPKDDPFAHKPATTVDEIGQLLRGIPGFGGGSKDADDNLANLPPIDTRSTSAFDANRDDVITPDMVAKQVEAVEQAAHPNRRRKKRRVAAWLDAYLDRPSFAFRDADREETAGSLQTAVAGTSENELNPIKLIEAKRFTTGQGDGARDIEETGDVEAPLMPPPQPHPLEFIRKALSFLPLPIFHTDDAANNQPTLPEPRSIQVVRSLSTPPVAPSEECMTLPSLGRQSKHLRNQLAPVPTAQWAMTPAVPAPRKLERGSFMDVLASLPKDFARTVEHAFRPKPVEIAPSTGAPPELASVSGVTQTRVDSGFIPTPSKAVSEPQVAYVGNLVEAQVAPPPPAAPSPVRKGAERTAAAPAPLIGAQVAEPAKLALSPSPSLIQKPTGAPPAPPAPSAPIPGGAQPSSVAPMAPTARGSVAGTAAPSPVLPHQMGMQIAGVPAPQAISASSYGSQMMSPPLPGTPVSSVPSGAPVPYYASATASAPPVMPVTVASSVAPSAVPAPTRATTPVIPPSLPMPPAEIANSSTARRLATQGFKFVAPNIASGKPLMLTAIKTAPKIAPLTAAQASPASAKPSLPDDEYAKRMKYLLEHGTSSLAPGEAFMFSEETGEGVLFMHGGNSVRRKLAEVRDHEEVARLRRPDILGEDGELRYNLSLLGKIIKPASTASRPNTAAGSGPRSSGASAQQPGTAFSAKPIVQNDDNLLGWLKNVFKF